MVSFLYCQRSFLSTSYEVVSPNKGILESGECKVQFVVDTSKKILIYNNLEIPPPQGIRLITLSPFIVRREGLKIWGYNKVESSSPFIKYVTFTESFSGSLSSINIHGDSLSVIFYITERLNL